MSSNPLDEKRLDMTSHSPVRQLGISFMVSAAGILAVYLILS